MARQLKAAHPQRRIPTKVAPMLLLRLFALFDPAVKGVLPMIRQLPKVSNARAMAEMEIQFTSPADALRASADWLLTNGQV
jgi:dihydroflavonol-4-reductase